MESNQSFIQTIIERISIRHRDSRGDSERSKKGDVLGTKLLQFHVILTQVVLSESNKYDVKKNTSEMNRFVD